MKWAVAVISIGVGVLMGELIARVPAGHEAAGRVFGRGHLIALVDGNGIFEADLKAFRAQKGVFYGGGETAGKFTALVCAIASWISRRPSNRSSSAAPHAIQ